MDKIPTLDYHFCENQSVDNVIGYYYALAQKEEIPFDARVDLPKELSVDEMDLCLILSNLLENALEASRKNCRCAAADIVGNLSTFCFYSFNSG